MCSLLKHSPSLIPWVSWSLILPVLIWPGIQGPLFTLAVVCLPSPCGLRSFPLVHGGQGMRFRGQAAPMLSSPLGCLAPHAWSDANSWRHVLVFHRRLMHRLSEARGICGLGSPVPTCILPLALSPSHPHRLLLAQCHDNALQQADSFSLCFVFIDSCSVNTFEDLLSARPPVWCWA